MYKIEQEIKLTHLPTGIVVIENESHSYFINRENAFKKLAEKIPNYKLEDVLIEQFRFA